MSISFEQLEAFVHSAECGSFSAAAKQMKKSPSAISLAISNLEIDLGISLFDRSSSKPVLTQHGQALLIDAKAVMFRSLELQSKARSLEASIEPEVTLLLDTTVPLQPLTEFLVAFERNFPHTTLNLSICSSAELKQRVAAEAKAIGFGLEVFSRQPEAWFVKNILRVPVSAVVRQDHPLATIDHLITLSELGDYRQLLLSPADGDAHDFDDPAKVSSRVWHIGDMNALLIAIRAGLGWGILPEHVTEEELKRGDLKKLELESESSDYQLTLGVFCHEEISGGPVVRWVIDSLDEFWLRKS